MGDMIQIKALDGEGEFAAYLAKPSGDAKAAIIVMPEIFGVNPGIRQKCDKMAALGYAAIAPDLFWRFAPGVQLTPDIEAEMNEAFGYFQQYDADDGVKDIEATMNALRGGDVAGKIEKVGGVGFCLGGRLAYMVATRTDIDCAVGYYGVMIDQMLDEAVNITNPLMLHIPTADGFVDADAQAAMHAGLDDHAKVTLHDYVGLDHGFATEIGNRRDEEGAVLADQRTLEFFAANLA